MGPEWQTNCPRYDLFVDIASGASICEHDCLDELYIRDCFFE
jgi:hypothetical protein